MAFVIVNPMEPLPPYLVYGQRTIIPLFYSVDISPQSIAGAREAVEELDLVEQVKETPFSF